MNEHQKTIQGVDPMNINNSKTAKALLLVGICSSIWTSIVVADDDVAALVVDNGSGMVSVPEPSTWSLLLIGAIGTGLFVWRKRKDK
jgi:hypothetical protein